MTLQSEQDASSGSPDLAQEEFTIGEFVDIISRLIGRRCTGAMINNYEHLGLLASPERSGGGFRKYKHKDVSQVLQIKKWQAAGYSLAQIRQLMLDDQLDEPVDMDNVPLPVGWRGKAHPGCRKSISTAGISRDHYFGNRQGSRDFNTNLLYLF